MKKIFNEHKKIIIGLILCILIFVIGGVFYFLYANENALTIEEKRWIDDNTASVININVINDVNIFGNNASGVYYDFLVNFSKNYNLTVNPITYKLGDTTTGITLGVKYILSENDVVFNTDHYVIISKEEKQITSYNELTNMTIGASKTDKEAISKYKNKITEYDNKTELLKAFENDEIKYIMVPRYLYANIILENNYEIIYHLSEINYFYTLEFDDSMISNIIKKYYNGTWKKNFNDSFKENEFDMYVNSLDLSESQVDKLSSVDYTYGFVENSPYEVISSGRFGGISAVLLSEFSELSNVEFEFVKYKNFSELVKAVKTNEVDVFLNKYNLKVDYDESSQGFNSLYYVVSSRENDIVVNSLDSLDGVEVYVEENTKVYDYISSNTDIKIKTYSGETELFKLNNSDVVIIIDSNSFDFYNLDDLNKYTRRYTFTTEETNNYAVKTDDMLFMLLDNFINLSNNDEIVIKGVKNHYDTISIGMIIATLAKYTLIFAFITLIMIIILIKKSKKIQITRKIKKDDKLKYIDQLTSLKNRNYFNDSKESWNNNTIYPQTIIIIDLNKIQKLNDQLGYNEGDSQIKSFANALIRTQLDNSEVMRTDGNEFVIYLIGYSQKQVVNYIHKLNKEVDKLPYKEGAKFGYDMILDNLKTVEDCLNDAANDMLEKNKK